MMGEIFPVCEKLRYTIAHGERDLAPEKRDSGVLMHKAVRVEYQPLGVVGVICPWNFPFHNVFCPVDPGAVRRQRRRRQGVGVDLVVGGRLPGHVRRGASTPPATTRDLVQIITGGGETGQALVQLGRREDLLHRLARQRQEGDGRRLRDADAGGARARRQGPDDHLRRRRSRPGGRHGDARRLHRLRADVRRRRAALRLRRHLRRVRRVASPSGRARCARGRRPRIAAATSTSAP